MRDKIVFFILGATLATIAYLAGNVGHLVAQERIAQVENITRFDRIEVSEIVVKNENGEIFIGFQKEDLWDHENHTDAEREPTIILKAKGSAVTGGGRILLRAEGNSTKFRMTTAIPPFENLLSEGIRMLTTGGCVRSISLVQQP